MASQDRDDVPDEEITGEEPIPEGPEVSAQDTLEFERLERKPRRHSRTRLVLIAAAVVGAGAGAWAVLGGHRAGSGGGVPEIHADTQPFKVRPENPGGMEVPDRDKLVYDRINPNAPAEAPEQLLPRPETPLPPPAGAADATAASPVAPATSEPPAEKSTMETAAAPSVQEVKEAKVPPPAPAPPARTIAASKVLMTGSYRVQLGAVRSQDGAQTEWARLRKRYPDLLGKLELVVTRADLGKKGVFYRLRAGPLSDQAAARKLCDDLAQKKVGCLVVRPGT
jgi:cell division septation protein DedD